MDKSKFKCHERSIENGEPANKSSRRWSISPVRFDLLTGDTGTCNRLSSLDDPKILGSDLCRNLKTYFKDSDETDERLSKDRPSSNIALHCRQVTYSPAASSVDAYDDSYVDVLPKTAKFVFKKPRKFSFESNAGFHSSGDDNSVELQSSILVTDVGPNDVLCGRGGKINNHPGNRAFRDLIKEHQDSYLQSKKKLKPNVAASIVWIIRERKGRFLKKDFATGAFYQISDEKALEKAQQALREGAPEIKKSRNIRHVGAKRHKTQRGKAKRVFDNIKERGENGLISTFRNEHVTDTNHIQGFRTPKITNGSNNSMKQRDLVIKWKFEANVDVSLLNQTERKMYALFEP
eukprot:CAMPEP_0116065402 /NCGR_PEP_ID=MMETSP0322-20121206/9742_1 /TAXON_ID=163516 /ORGANISM="Leptocylindrus danicus var. apora, Strain B651" /LENGTH=347 /DNA_ID=CAMNT_0003551711 /DNA_START=119 /DNA_END=1159 /DNA_ORIENTATION=+